MKKYAAVPVIALFLCILVTAPGLAATTKATVYLVHGLPGKDIGKTADIPVDISFNGLYKAKAFKLLQVSPALSLAAGSYSLKVYEAGLGPANAAAPLIQKSIVLGEGEQATVIIHLTSAKKATLTKFTNDLSPVANRASRFIVHGTAAVSAFAAGFTHPTWPDGHPLYQADAIANGNKIAVEITPQYGVTYFFEVTEANEDAYRLFSKMMPILANKVNLIYVIGAPKTATFNVIIKSLTVK
jgi:hypothetical protein